MDTKTLSSVISWSKTTDLKEIVYKKDGVFIEIRTAQAGPRQADFSCTLTPVKAPALGIFHSGIKGGEIVLREDMSLKKHQILGSVETNKTFKEVLCPCHGVLKIISIKDGQSVQYNQPLFFIEPKR